MQADGAAPEHVSPARVLWVTEEVPDRSGGGGNIRQAYLLEAVANAFTADLLVAGKLRDGTLRRRLRTVHELPAPVLPPRRGPVSKRMFLLAMALLWPGTTETWATRKVRHDVSRSLAARTEPTDLVVVVHGHMASVLPTTRSGHWILIFHHLSSVMAHQEQAKATGRRHRWLWRMEERKALRLQERALRAFDAVVVCSDEDAAVLRALVPDAEIAVVPNGVNIERFPVTPVPPDPRILLPATLGYAPNVDGARWFCDQVFPLVRQQVPDARLDIVGREPVPEVLELAKRDGVEVHPDVPTLVPYFGAARVVVVPLRVGTGTRLKALEAMAAARPVVGTRIGLEGLQVVDGETARVADDPETMASALVELLTEDDRATALARAGRALVEERFGWDGIGARYVAWLRDQLAARGTASAVAVP